MWRLILAFEVFNLRRLSIESIYASLLVLTVYVYTKIVVPIDLLKFWISVGSFRFCVFVGK